MSADIRFGVLLMAIASIGVKVGVTVWLTTLWTVVGLVAVAVGYFEGRKR